jgi:hypothetical protein
MRRAAVAFLAAALLDGCSASRRGTPLQSPPAAAADTLPALPAADRVRVAEAFRLAAAVGGVATIVVGQPAHTGQTSTRWVLTVLHEHFHQLQFSQPGYYPGVTALGLARGDTTGMWMLNHGFPYDSVAVQARFAAFLRSLEMTLTPRPAAARDTTARGPAVRAVAEARPAPGGAVRRG